MKKDPIKKDQCNLMYLKYRFYKIIPLSVSYHETVLKNRQITFFLYIGNTLFRC